MKFDILPGELEIRLAFLDGDDPNRQRIKGLTQAFFKIRVNGGEPVFAKSPFMVKRKDVRKGTFYGRSESFIAVRTRFKEILLLAKDHFIAIKHSGIMPTPEKMIKFLESFNLREGDKIKLRPISHEYAQTNVKLGKWKSVAPNERGTVKKGSAEKLFNASIAHLFKFMDEVLGIGEISPGDVTIGFIEKYEVYLRDKMAPSSIANYILALRTFFDYLVKHEYIKTNVFHAYDTERVAAEAKGSKDYARRITRIDSDKLKNTPIEGYPDLEQYRKVAAFQVMTGMAWIDISVHGPSIRDRITINLSGERCLIFNRVKNGGLCMVPLSPDLLELIEAMRYNINPGSYKTYTYNLKRVFEKLDIHVKKVNGRENEKFSHALRHTFGNDMLEDGFSMDSVSRMMGHSSIKITESVYAKVGEDKIFADLKRIKEHNQSVTGVKTQISS